MEAAIIPIGIANKRKNAVRAAAAGQVKGNIHKAIITATITIRAIINI